MHRLLINIVLENVANLLLIYILYRQVDNNENIPIDVENYEFMT